MEISQNLFEGRFVCLTPVDPEKDPEIESRWTHNPAYLRMLSPDPVRPLSPFQIKKKYEAVEKEAEESRSLFYFAIRSRSQPVEGGGEPEPERLLGFGRLFWIEWTHSAGRIELGIGDPADWGKGYGTEALSLLLHYAFGELNLYRLLAVIPEYNEAARRIFQKAGFQEEVRRRQALNRDGRRWDLLTFGLLRGEWEAQLP